MCEGPCVIHRAVREVIQVTCDEVIVRRNELVGGNEIRIMFCEGPEGLVKAVVRNFPCVKGRALEGCTEEMNARKCCFGEYC